MNFDISDDLAEVVDWTRSVSLDGEATDYSLRRGITTEEAAASGGRFTTADVVFHLPQNQVASVPVPGSQIVDESETWTVLSVGNLTLASRYRCVCRKLWIDPTLTVTIQAQASAKGSTGAIVRTWQTIAEDVVAKIVVDQEEVSSSGGSRASYKMATVFFVEPIDLLAGHRIVSLSGETFEAQSWQGFSELDGLFRANVKQIL